MRAAFASSISTLASGRYRAHHTTGPDDITQPRSRRTQRGSAAVEFALIAPLLIILALGVIDFGLYINEASVVGNAAREGARAGSLGASASEIDAVVSSSISALPSAPTTANVSCRKPTGLACSSYNEATSGGTAIVRVTRTHKWLTPLAFGTTIDIVRSSQMRIE
ncbi:MAG TPA: TadE family protein [Glaciihabitans sp.]|jgi:Flp pilus assembly protein TadG|nr:TadE family protein [Glaciihabitans sp.]